MKICRKVKWTSYLSKETANVDVRLAIQQDINTVERERMERI